MAPTKGDHQEPAAARPAPAFTSSLQAEEADFPRGGGSSLTAFEFKQVREEGRKEAEEEAKAQASKGEKRKRQVSERQTKRLKKNEDAKKREERDKEGIRVELLNYKRLATGTRVLARVHTILPLHLILSLPNNLLAHVPITEVSNTLTQLLRAEEDAAMEDEEEDESDDESSAPDLAQLFVPGQYVPAKVLTLYPTASQSFVSQYPVTETTRLAARVELTLIPEKVNSEVAKKDLEKGYLLTGEVKSEEDKGWTVAIGLDTEDGGSSVEGFVSKDDAKKSNKTLIPGQLVPSTISSIAAGGRLVQLTLNPTELVRSQVSEVSTVGSLVPGHLVTALITAVVPSGLNVKVAGFFDGTLDFAHLPLGEDDVEEKYKIGKKIRARIIYDNLSADPRSFSLSALPHVVDLTSPTQEGDSTPLELAIPIGKIYQSTKVTRVLNDWGVMVRTQDGLEGFVHISHLADERIPVLSKAVPQFKPGTLHRARVIGHSPLDGVLLLSFEQSVLSQTFMQVTELKIGQQLKGVIRKLTDTMLFVNIHGNVDGIVQPNHYADIKLKHPAKRFRPDASVKARVWSVDPIRNRVVLTLKKTFIESDATIPQSFEDFKVGLVTLGSVLKIVDKGIVVELFGGLKAFMPHSECSQTFVKNLNEAFHVGKPLSIRVIEADPETARLVVSAKQASASAPATAAEKLEVGEAVTGVVSQVHAEQVVVKLDGSGLTALLSLSNLSNQKRMGIEELRESLKAGDKIEDLVIVSKNPVSGLIIVNIKKTPSAKKTKTKEEKAASGISANVKAIDSIELGQILEGTVSDHTPNGWMVKISHSIRGRVHPCDAADDLSLVTAQKPLSVGKHVKCYVLKVDASKRAIDLSTRPSRVEGKEDVVDKEISTVGDLKEGSTVRGLVKNIAGSGVFVSLGRNVTARIMIKELFDEYVKDWQSRFEVGQLVSGKIVSINSNTNSIELSLRKSPTRAAKKTALLSLSDFTEGQKVVASVKKVEAYGMFLKIDGSNVSGLCHKSEITDNKKADVAQALKGFREGDQVKAKITSIDIEKNKISFGIKASYFGEDFEGGEDDEEEEEADNDVEMESGDELQLDQDESEAGEDDEDEEEDSEAEAQDDAEDDDDEEEDDDDEELQPEASTSAPKTALNVASFDWTGDAPEAGPSDSESDSDDETSAPTKGKGKNVDLTATAPSDRPSSTAEYERALLASPNSSFLWIQYMSFYLQLHEIEKARKIGRQALEKISYREEEEKLNVWMALINLEIGFGTMSSAEKLFEEASQYNDKRTVFMRYADALQAAGKEDAVEEVFKKIVKKFSAYPESWTRFAEFYLLKGDADGARALLPRSLKSLDKSKHVETIEKMALLEFKHGDAERAKTLFEGLVDRLPKRLDLWGVYIDQLGKGGDIQGVRGLFDRALNQKLTSKKAKFLFKKWLSLESRIGDAPGQEKAKLRAKEWVEANSKPVTGGDEESGSDEEEE
ncbi:rRNA biogenesis protein RRP5 [Cryptococcus wingfieldii CBS 7118]|uniref:rRNA biogenesis protein RRP5 n=1 Tax=Cryptococcus wingfieldii CBS 7118 TaxID=1295528 RepID=A0A1E3JKV4_9TREE|nr:rRNA biogenesis protein RRP5 [Cryptococcus wingfieldii CBS 7118]ODO00747.1 rRNA biogenesis protein RRP5 [Cryptococcus wingfieldii CBS 7118]